jgi:hypothetical protein
MALQLCHSVAFGAVFYHSHKGRKIKIALCFQLFCNLVSFTASPLLGTRGQVVFNHKILWQKF